MHVFYICIYEYILTNIYRYIMTSLQLKYSTVSVVKRAIIKHSLTNPMFVCRYITVYIFGFHKYINDTI